MSRSTTSRTVSPLARVTLLAIMVTCLVTAWPETTTATPECCVYDVMCQCGELQCCSHESLGAMACSAGDPDYCRATCDGNIEG